MKILKNALNSQIIFDLIFKSLLQSRKERIVKRYPSPFEQQIQLRAVLYSFHEHI